MATKKAASRAAAPPDESFLDFPPFPGFDKVGFAFLKEIKANNVREWLTPERKAVYQNHLVEPMKQLLSELALRFRQEDLPFYPDPKASLFRLYRDTRFSKDKTPFKTNIGAVVPFMNEAKEGVGNYIHIDPGSCFFGGGAYFMDSPGLKRLRARIDADPAALRAIFKQVEKDFGPVSGEKLKRAPAGYPVDHPAIDLLVYTQMWTSKKFPDKLAMSPELVDWIVDMSRKSMAFNRYLYESVRGA